MAIINRVCLDRMELMKKIILLLPFFLWIGNAFAQNVYKKLPEEYQGNRSIDTKKIQTEINKIMAFDLIQALPKKHVEDASEDYTDIIQNVINTHSNVIFPSFPLLINEKGLSLKSNSALIFRKGSDLVLKPNALRAYAIISIKSQSNITLFFPKITGDRRSHLAKDGEWGMGISIYGGRNIRIIGASISECWGDGIYIANNRSTISNGIVVQDARLDYNRRNGVTLVGGNYISILSPIISNTMGTGPMSGIDIEPNKGGGIINNVTIKDFISFNNGKSGLQIGLSRYPSIERKEINILISNFSSYNNPYGIVLGGFYHDYDKSIQKVSGSIIFNDININNATEENIKMGRNYHFGPNISFEKVLFTKNLGLDSKSLNSFKASLQKHPKIKIIN